MGGAARFGLLVSVGAIAITLATWLLTGRVFLLLFAALGPGLFYVLSGAPRAIEVGHDEVVVRSWLRRARHLPASHLAVQYDGEELVLVTADETIALSAELFPHGSLERCIDALRAIVPRP